MEWIGMEWIGLDFEGEGRGGWNKEERGFFGGMDGWRDGWIGEYE